MTDLSTTAPEVLASSKLGRSLWDDAYARLTANKAAMTSFVVLGIVTFLCVVGPFLSPHNFDRVYQDYVKVPSSLESYPKSDAVEPTLIKALKRARITLAKFQINGDQLEFSGTSKRKINPKSIRYIDRSNLFEATTIKSMSEDGREVVMSTKITRIHFYFGTDANGRDLMTRTLIAGRVSLMIGLLASGVALMIGVTYGSFSGYMGGRTDLFMMRVVDILYSLPFIFFVILLVVFFGRNFVLMFIAVGAVEWLDMARIVRGQTLSIRRQEYVQAAEAMGVQTGGILRRHVIPNTLGPVVVYVTLLVPRVILLESFLSFLGLGVQEPMTSWGVLISEGSRNLQGSPWMLIFPSIFLTGTLFALNFIGDGLRDALDPKDR
ncbi:MAG: ABC transporter permease subunit [Cohaesibacteraceae bacterium]|nr:ABC transporter permease subunit [Cohaesibacteraceae bacterium]